MEKEEKKEGITLGEVFRIIKKRIWFVLGMTILFAAAAVLLIEFIINPMIATYSMDFHYVFPRQDSGSYPDGTPFFFQEIVTPDALKDARETGRGFEGIDVENMSRRSGIAIEAEAITVQEVEEYTGRYTVTVDASYFDNEGQAEAFIRAVAEVPVRKMQEIAKGLSYTVAESTFNSAPFEERLRLLADLKESLLRVCNQWISCYSENYNVRITESDGKVSARRLRDYRDGVVVLYGESVQRELKNELEFGGYYFGDLGAYKEQLRKEYERNEKEKAAIEDHLSERWTELNTRNIQIDEWINVSGAEGREPTLTEENIAAFADRLSAEFEKLNKQAEVLAGVTAAIYQNGTFARFYSEKVTSSGGIGLLLGAVCSLVLAFLVACCLGYALEMRARKKAAAQTKSTDGGDPESPENSENPENDLCSGEGGEEE